jgi:dihydrofolate reductase
VVKIYVQVQKNDPTTYIATTTLFFLEQIYCFYLQNASYNLLIRKMRMRKIVSKVWMTLDGVFDADNMDKWWFPYDSAERTGYITDRYVECDAYLLGRNTYEMLAPYWSTQTNDKNGPASWLNSVRKYVVSSTLKKAEWNNSTIIKENVIEAVTKLKQQSGKAIIIDGSATLVRSLMEADLIDEYWLLVSPIVIGSGRRFFEEGMPSTTLKLVKSETFSLGVVSIIYQVDR